MKLIAGTAPGFSAPALPPPPDSYARDARAAMLVLTIKLDAQGTYTVPAAPGAGADVHRNLYVCQAAWRPKLGARRAALAPRGASRRCLRSSRNPHASARVEKVPRCAKAPQKTGTRAP